MCDAVKVKQAVPFYVHFLTIYPWFFSICQDKLCTMRTNSSFRKKNECIIRSGLKAGSV